MGFWRRLGEGIVTGGLSEARRFAEDPALDRTQSGAAREFQHVDPDDRMLREAQQAGNFAQQGEGGFGNTGLQMTELGDVFRRQMSGQDSVSAEQLRQSLGQQQAQFQSFAAGARPGNQAMAARQAMLGMGRAGSAAAGQQAIAGLQERNLAAQQLGALLGTQRQQDLSAALGSRGLAIQGLGDIEAARTARYGAALGVPTGMERFLGFGAGAAQAGALASDKRLKKDIKPGDDDADVDGFIEGLKAFTYKYKDRKWGEGKQLGVLAQDVQKTPFGKQIVRETSDGLMLDSAKLSGANSAAIARLGERLAKLETKK